MRIHVWTALICAGLVCGLVRETPGQSVRPDAAIPPQPRHGGAFVVGDRREESAYETTLDIEIMGRLLGQTVEDLFERRPDETQLNIPALGSSARMLDAYGGYGRARQSPTPVEGKSPVLSVRLPDQGVVFQMESAPLREPEPESGPSEAKQCPFTSRTQWEQARLRLTGEIKNLDCRKCHAAESIMNGLDAARSVPKSSSRAAAAMGDLLDTKLGIGVAGQASTVILSSKPHRAKADRSFQFSPTRDELIAALLDVVAENGHRLRHLSADEKITVAITFRNRTEDDGTAAKGKTQNSKPSATFDASSESPFGSMSSTVSKNLMSGLSPMPDDAFSSFGQSPNPASQEVAGDLQMRQGRYAEAIKAYEEALRKQQVRAIESAEGVAIFLVTKNPPRQQHELYRKLIQAYVAAGNLDKAAELLKSLRAATEKEPAKVSDQQQEHPGPPLPARLVVSVKKIDADAVAKGELSRDEFEKRAEISFFDPQAISQPSKPESTVKAKPADSVAAPADPGRP